MASNLSKKQELFVAEYLIDQNATRAYVAAGYSAQGAAQSASALLRNPKVSSRISQKHEKRLDRLEITADRVLAEIAKLGFANMQDYLAISGSNVYVDLSRLTREQAAAIQEVTIEEYVERTGPNPEQVERVKRTKFKLSDKRGALELLGRHLKLFTDRVAVEGELNIEIADVRQKLLSRLARGSNKKSA